MSRICTRHLQRAERNAVALCGICLMYLMNRYEIQKLVDQCRNSKETAESTKR